MLEITRTLEGATLRVALSGKLDVLAANTLDDELGDMLDDVSRLVVDMANLSYISSAGLRVLLKMFRKLEAQGGTMAVENATDEVGEVLMVTGFSDLLIAR